MATAQPIAGPHADAAARPDEGRLARLTTMCMLAYLSIYCLESPVRYVLYLGHASPAILARDALIDLPITLLVLSQILRGKLDCVLLLCFLILAIQCPIFLANFGSAGLVPMIFGIKLIVNAMLGLIAGRSLIVPDRRTYWLMAALLAVCSASLLIEKLGGNFPWVGLHDTIGGADIVISRDWQIDDPVLRRVGGFFRDSIAAAVAIPLLAIIVAARLRRLVWRGLVLLVAFAAVSLTTQKGGMAAMLFVICAMCLSQRLRLIALRVLVVLGAFLNATMPFFASGMDLQQGRGGVASAMSFAMRIKSTWPNSWGWVNAHSVFPFGVGIGGMGVPLKQIAPTAWMFPDNMFIFVYAYFGVFAVLFYVWFAHAAWRSIGIEPSEAEPALAVLAFILLYGIVVSMIEDQMASLFLGASAGVLLTAKVKRQVEVSKGIAFGGVEGQSPHLASP